jgi:regulatory protein
MPGRRARTGRGWDAAPPRTRAGTSADAQKPGKTEKPPVDPYERAREICLRQLSFRPRTRSELATALRKHEIDDDVATSVLERYTEVGLIDDAAFAKAWVSSRHHGRGLARRALADELRRKGVESEVVSEALDDLDGETEVATARTLVERKLRSMGNTPPDAVFRRLVAMLARKGYPPGIVIGAVKDALAARVVTADFAGELDVDDLVDQAATEDFQARS